MADAILYNTAGKLLEVLGSQVYQEIGLAYGVKDEISKLKETVDTIKAVLLDAEKQYDSNEEVKVWLRRLKDAFYDADDLLDDFSTEFLKRQVMTGSKIAKEVRIFLSSSNQLAYSLNMGHKIKAIRKRLDEIRNDKQFHLVERVVETHVGNRGREQTHSFVRAEDVIGREDDKTAIKKLLLESNDVENVSVIPIVGFGGIGKTTLVQSIYNDEEIDFQLKMWVCVSDVFNVREIVKDIIRSATGEELGNLNMEQLQGRLRKAIDGRKYLLVLDDVWNEDRYSWLELKTLLMDGGRGSTIIVTTRSVIVAEVTRTLSMYTLRALSEDMSWSLFVRMAFEHGVEPKDSKLVTIGKEIVAKCAGTPLVIKTLGTFLYTKNEVVEWSHFRDEELLKIAHDRDVLRTLRLSYDHLPSHLKQCFAYCALFPKDRVIQKQLLVNLWMAQGFIRSPHRNQCLEDVGNMHFMTLLSRSFFQDAKDDDCGNVISCKMHDLMHDLAVSVAGSECVVTTSSAENINERARHISIHSKKYSWIKIQNEFRAKHIRTLFLPTWGNLDASHCDKIISSFKRLRTLKLSRSRITKLSGSIGKLKHLRYLDLSFNDFEELPDSMSMLVNLETLDLTYCLNLQKIPDSMSMLVSLETLNLSYCDKLGKLPRDMRKMVSLKHVMIDGCGSLTCMPYGIELLTSLRTLPLFVVDRTNSNKYAKLSELSKLNRLRGKLKIENLGHVECDISEFKSTELLEDKPYLQRLILDGARSEWDTDGRSMSKDLLDVLQPHRNLKELEINEFGGLEISDWLSSMINLTSIHLCEFKRCKYIPSLDQFPSLKKLSLWGFENLEHIYYNNSSSTIFFPSLEQLTLGGCRNLKECWSRKDEATSQMAELPSFPCLSKLEIWSCPNLTSMPLYPSLVEELALFDTTLKPLQQTMENLMDTATSSTFTAPLSKLKSLKIGVIVDDSESLLMEGLRNLTSLVDLCITTSLTSQLCQSIAHVTSVENLTIKFCSNELDLLKDANGKLWQGFTNLRYLCVSNVSKMVSLPKGLQYVTTLQRLHISGCGDLLALPVWICNFTSLRDIQLLNCVKLTSLPQLGMQLQKLVIYGCPLLEIRDNTSVDWPNIAHIPNITIDGKTIQSAGHYRL